MGKSLLERPVVRLPVSSASTISFPYSPNAAPTTEACLGSSNPANASMANNQQSIHDVGTSPGTFEGKSDLKGSKNSPKMETGSSTELHLSLPIDLGAKIVDDGDLEKTVRQLEMKLQGLETQFKRFEKSHNQLVQDYHELESYHKELRGSLGLGQSRTLPTGMGNGVSGIGAPMNTMGGIENSLEHCGMASRSGSASPNRVDTTSRNERLTTRRGRAIGQISTSSSESGYQRQASQTRSLPFDHSGGVQTQIGSLKADENSSRKASSIPCDIHAHPGDLSQSSSNSSSSDWGPADDQRMKPRTLPKRMTIETCKPREIIGSVSLGADFEAFQIPRWSRLGLDTMDTFKSAQGPSVIRKWKNGKPPASAV